MKRVSESSQDSRRFRVGIGSRNYSYRRVCYDLPLDSVHFTKPLYMPWKFLRKGYPCWQNTYLFVPRPNVDLVHLWNGICLNRVPWVSSFEGHLPRYHIPQDSRLYQMALDRLHRSNCRRLLALSDFAKEFFFAQNDGLLDSSIGEKTSVFYGGVELPENALARREDKWWDSQDFVVCMIGHDFFRKGGVALLRACQRLQQVLRNMRLVIVSRLTHGDYVTVTSEEDRNAILSDIDKLPNVEWHEKLPHEEVLELLARAHVGVLTSLDETFGWSIVEAMSCGLPVISTNVCAMPEIVRHGVNGYQIKLPLQASRRWTGLQHPGGSQARRTAVDQATEILEEGIYKYLRELAEDRDALRRMSEAAVQHVRTHHDPEQQALALLSVYREAV